MSAHRHPQYTRIGLFLLLTSLLIGLGRAPTAIQGQSTQGGTFADPAFRQLWERTDALVAGGTVSRTWLWGPGPGFSTREAWAEAPGGSRLVQYFDKGRMEISDPTLPPGDPFYTTNGLLAYELISGQQQIGRNAYTARTPANIPVAGDRTDSEAPTYASFRAVSNLPGAERRAANAVGQPVNQAIARSGAVGPLPPPRQDYGVRVAYWDETTGHNVPDVFWNFLNGPGTVLENGQIVPRRLFDPWFAITGLPISEAYWTYVNIGNVFTEVLVQPFERRVLTYAPNNPDGFKVEMGNIGMHYLEWRYTQPPAPPPPTTIPLPVRPPDVRITGIINQKPGLDLNFQQIALLNASGGPVNMSGWRLVSPQSDHDEIYTFPQFTLPAGGTVTVYAGWGYNTPTQLYMNRVTWYFLGLPFDGVVLYDGAGREVTRYFLTGGIPPTPQPILTPQASPTSGGPPVDLTATPTPRPKPSNTPGGPTNTPGLPTAVPSSEPTLGTGNTATPTTTPTVTSTPAGGTPTPTLLPSGTPTPRVSDDGTALSAWVDDPSPSTGDQVDAIAYINRNSTPVAGAAVAITWHFPGGDAFCSQLTTAADGIVVCDKVIPQAAAGQIVWIDVAARVGASSIYTTNTGLRVNP